MLCFVANGVTAVEPQSICRVFPRSVAPESANWQTRESPCSIAFEA